MLKKKLYLAYGSNLNIKQMEWRCPTAVVQGTAIINDFELLFRGHRHSAVATIEPFKGGIVPVIVWEIRPADEYALDRYEGFPHFYQKEMLTVNFNGADVKAMAYIMTAGRAWALHRVNITIPFPKGIKLLVLILQFCTMPW